MRDPCVTSSHFNKLILHQFKVKSLTNNSRLVPEVHSGRCNLPHLLCSWPLYLLSSKTRLRLFINRIAKKTHIYTYTLHTYILYSYILYIWSFFAILYYTYTHTLYICYGQLVLTVHKENKYKEITLYFF